MKSLILNSILLFLSINLISQGINQKAIEINNNDNANYIAVPGTKIKIIPPRGFVSSKRFLGFEHEIAGSSIVITEIPENINKTMMGFDKAYLLKAGIFLESQKFYRINNFDALLITGKQTAYNNIYIKHLLIIGNTKISYLLNASLLATSSEKHQKEVLESLLSVIFMPEIESDVSQRFDFSIDVSGTELKKAKMMISSLTYTDDGNLPSKTENKTSVTVRKATTSKELSENEKKELTIELFKIYPKEVTANSKNIVKEIKGKYLSGYEIYSIGKNSSTGKPELIYQAVFFKDKEYYVFNGFTSGNFETNLEMFRKIAKTLKLENTN